MIVHGCTRLFIKVMDSQQIGAFVPLYKEYKHCESGGKVRKTKKNRRNGPGNSITKVVMTCDEVAEYLRVHVSSVRRWSRSGKITAYRVGGCGDWRYREQDVMAFLYGTPVEGKEREDAMAV
jgi:excisionase family DNA binding protein